MNILWIEDNENIDKLKTDYFGNLPYVDENISIDVPKSFDEALKKVKNAKSVYDLIIIDINLELFDIGEDGERLYNKFDDIKSQNDFLKEAGFHLYLRLTKLGFENNRIVFLTGNTNINNRKALHTLFTEALQVGDHDKLDQIRDQIRKQYSQELYDEITTLMGKGDIKGIDQFWKKIIKEDMGENGETLNTYPIFKKRFESARMKTPIAIHKDNVSEFHSWLENRLTKKFMHHFEYITLRRGIIEGCDHFMKEIEEGNITEKEILFNQSTDNHISLKEIQQKLNRLKSILPLNIPEGENKNSILLIFLKEISFLWDRSRGYLRKRDYKNDLEYKFKNFCQKQMKLLRNWSAHDQLSHNLNEEFVAFQFIIFMRGLFDIDLKDIKDNEKILGRLFQKENEKKEILDGLVDNLPRSYFDLRNIFKRSNPRGNAFADLMADVCREETFSSDRSTHYFYHNFWHSIFPAYLKIAEPKKGTEGMAMYINFPKKESDIPEDSVIEFIATHIFSVSFE